LHCHNELNQLAIPRKNKTQSHAKVVTLKSQQAKITTPAGGGFGHQRQEEESLAALVTPVH